MSLLGYKTIHLVGLMMLFISLGGLALLGGLGADAQRAKPYRAVLSAFHGLGLLLLIVAGFGLLARLGAAKPADWGGWVHAKMVLWLLFGAAVVPLKRMPQLGRLWLVVLTAMGGVTAWIALFKPF